MNNKSISIIIPMFNEEKNVNPIYEANIKSLNKITLDYEIIFINDGSNDNTLKNIELLIKKDKKVKLINFRRNFGQTAAMDAGFKFAKKNVLIPMDGDLQNDPSDIPKLLKKLDEGYDIISGWRKNRKDSFFKNMVSHGANILRSLFFNDSIHDSGCSFKAYKKECFEELNLYGEMHRFIPAILESKGFKIGEVVVKHHPRKFGKTKYGFKRIIKGFLDMIVVSFWIKYSNRPMHIFGGFGIISGFIGFFVLSYLSIIKLFFNQSIANRPLLILGVLLLIIGVQFMIFGILADILIKLYYKDKPNYNIKEIK